MSDVKVEHKSAMTRHEAARWFADVAEALGADGKAKFKLAGSTVELEVPDHLRIEAEVEVDGDEVELEFELKWSLARKDAAPTTDAPRPKEDAPTKDEAADPATDAPAPTATGGARKRK